VNQDPDPGANRVGSDPQGCLELPGERLDLLLVLLLLAFPLSFEWILVLVVHLNKKNDELIGILKIFW